MPYLKINYDCSKPTFEELDLPDDWRSWLDACYNVIGCRTIETTSTVIPDVVLVLDDEGKLRYGWENRINKVASVLYGSDCDPIVGDAILARVNDDGLVPLTSDDVDRLRRYFR